MNNLMIIFISVSKQFSFDTQTYIYYIHFCNKTKRKENINNTWGLVTQTVQQTKLESYQLAFA